MTPSVSFRMLFQLRQLVLDFAPAPLALDEVVDHAALDRAGTIERVQRRQVFNAISACSGAECPHAARFKLEDAGGQRRCETPSRRSSRRRAAIVSRSMVRAAVCSISFSAVVNDGQRRQPEEVHLQQAHLFDGLHVIGGHDFVVLGLVQRHQLGQRLRRNHHARRMHAGSRAPGLPACAPYRSAR